MPPTMSFEADVTANDGRQDLTPSTPALPLYHRADAHVWPPWLEGVRPTGHQAPVTLWVEE